MTACWPTGGCLSRRLGSGAPCSTSTSVRLGCLRRRSSTSSWSWAGGSTPPSSEPRDATRSIHIADASSGKLGHGGQRHELWLEDVLFGGGPVRHRPGRRLLR